ncbi:MAG: LPS export ABC transporter periplasmic protein LptC [Candidatus Methylomirabilia bacterium]
MSATRWLRIKTHAGRVLLAGLGISVVAGVFWFRRMSVEDQQQAPPGLPANDTKAEMVTRDFRHVETRMDRTVWVLESARAEIFEDKANLHTVKITWYGEPGEVTVVITSKEGTVDFKRRKAELRGDVRLARADGAVMSTEEIFWNDRKKVLRAPLPVLITTPNFTVRGASLLANLKTERITLVGPVQGEIRSGALVKARPS